MRVVPKWNDYFMHLAGEVSKRSKDPSTQVGAVIVDREHHILATGYNGFPPGCEDNDRLWERPIKYDRVIHAELNAIAQAARLGHAIDGAVIYTTAFPCNECAKAIIASGIRKIYAGPPLHGWGESYKLANGLLTEAKVRIGKVNANDKP